MIVLEIAEEFLLTKHDMGFNTITLFNIIYTKATKGVLLFRVSFNCQNSIRIHFTSVLCVQGGKCSCFWLNFSSMY